MTQKITFNKSRDKIAIIASASGLENSKEKLAKFEEILGSMGFKCTHHDNILSGDAVPYFASSKTQRVDELRQAISDPNVRIIWSFRGGYGAAEVGFDCLDLRLTADKILIGFSDITALFPLFEQKFNMPAIHGSVVTALLPGALKENMLTNIIEVLSGRDTDIVLEPLGAQQNNTITGKITGGNLTVICSLIGTDLQIDIDEKIIFLEDVGEKGYRVHRCLLQMYQAGLFAKAKAVIFGDFIKSDDNLDISLTDFCRQYLTIPVFMAKGVGHDIINYPVVIGGEAQIKNNILTVKSPFELI